MIRDILLSFRALSNIIKTEQSRNNIIQNNNINLNKNHKYTFSPSTDDSKLNTELHWLVNIERKAVIPSKWMLLAISIVLVIIETGRIYPEIKIFTVLAFYTLTNLVFSYIFYLRRYASAQIYRLEYFSLATDITFVTLLIYLTSILDTGRVLQTDYYLLYFLIILRGVVLFPSKTHIIIINSIISVLYMFTVFASQQTLRFISSDEFIIRLILLWGVMLMSWFILEIVQIQRERIQDDVNRIRQMEDQIIRTERLASMGEIAAGVAHEINNPVGIITTTTDFLLRKSPTDDPNYHHLKIIAIESERCKRIVAELLNLSSPSKIKTDSIDICQLLKDTIAIVQHEADKYHIQIKFDCNSNLPLIEVNQTLLQRAIVNLYSNAIQSMPKGGNLSIQVKYHNIAQQIIITITDNGQGIPESDMDNIFTPFFSTESGRSGLGLSITHRIIDWHGGQITVDSHLNIGTTFEIILPINRNIQ